MPTPGEKTAAAPRPSTPRITLTEGGTPGTPPVSVDVDRAIRQSCHLSILPRSGDPE